jgi:hypothetical protein
MDGRGPPKEIIARWLKIVNNHFFGTPKNTPPKA